MIRFNKPALALAIAAASFAVTGPAMAQKAKPAASAPAGPKLKLSKEFAIKADGVLKAWQTAKARPDVVAAQAAMKSTEQAIAAATTRNAQKAAETSYDTAQKALVALVQPEINGWRTLAATLTTNDERYQAGAIGLDIGLFTGLPDLQRQALELELASGLVNPAQVPLFNYYVGKFAFNTKDYMAARASLERATQAGYYDNEAGRYLAETYFAQNDARGGLASLRASLDGAKAAGKPVSIPALQRGLKVSSDAIIGDQAVYFATELLRVQPSTANWQAAFTAIRRAGKFDKVATLDLARLVDRTNAYETPTDYIELIQIGTDLALPKEVLATTAKGIAAGKIMASDPAVAEPRKVAETRVKADEAAGLLRGYERDAALPTAKTNTVIGAADSFLSYGQPAKAEQFYKLAMTKPGVDVGLVGLRLGIAQYDQGKYGEAAVTFRQVTGTRAPIAALWAVQADLKAKPAV